MAEPTIADVLTRLDRTEQRAEVVTLETRASLAELRNDIQELRSRMTTLSDELAAFRAEYSTHKHGKPV